MERVKELDLAHRNRLRSSRQLTLTLRYLSGLASAFGRPTLPTWARRVRRPDPDKLAITFVGHATVMVTTPRTRILIDPLLSDHLFLLRRARAAGVVDEDLRDVGLVLISHAGFDRLHRPSLDRLPRAATVIVPPRCAELVSSLGFARVIELGTGSDFGYQDVEVIAVPARHRGARGLGGRGDGSGYIIRSGGMTVYSAGGTGYFSGFTSIGKRFRPDAALLPIGGYEPGTLRDSHMSPLDAAYAFEDLQARVMIPVRHGDFALGYEHLDEPVEWLRDVARERGLEDRVAILAPGQTCFLRRPAEPEIPIEVLEEDVPC